VERLLTFRQIAEQTGIPEGTLRYWRHIGEGPEGYRIGRRVCFPESKVTAWFESMTTSTSDGHPAAS
jgi:excisionase family DNA binding protein